jgi:hypothetical protein
MRLGANLAESFSVLNSYFANRIDGRYQNGEVDLGMGLAIDPQRWENRMRSMKYFQCAAVAIAMAGLAPRSHADSIPLGWEANNLEPVGYSTLDNRKGAFKMAIKKVNGHWYLYMGHLWHYGWSIVDVTDPKDPKFVKTIQGPKNTWTIQMTLHDNIMVTALEKSSLAWGADPNKPNEEGVLIWDISDPVNPRQLSHWKTGATGTHRNSYPGGKYAYLSAAAPGFSSNILVILDMSDPAQPKEAGRWWMTGQREGETKAEGPEGFHGPANISPDGKIASMAYSPAAVNLDISDVTNPKLIGKLTFSPPFVAVGAPSLHTALPLWDRNLLYVNSEAIAERCNEALNFAGLVDNRNPARPRLMSLFPVPVPPKGAPYKNFCEKGGRFGPHNVNQEIHLPDVEKPGNLIYLTYFNAGLRVYNIKDPLLPVETGWFIPPQPSERVGPLPRDLVTQTEDVLVDTRGYIYVTDKQWGLWILRYTGPDQPAPTDK